MKKKECWAVTSGSSKGNVNTQGTCDTLITCPGTQFCF